MDEKIVWLLIYNSNIFCMKSVSFEVKFLNNPKTLNKNLAFTIFFYLQQPCLRQKFVTIGALFHH